MKLTDKIPPYSKNWFINDTQFHTLYPEPVRAQARMHWSPLYIVQKAVAYLATNNTVKILDIGSGTGKFCLAGAYYKPSVSFIGVEQRKNLIEYAEAAQQEVGLQN